MIFGVDEIHELREKMAERYSRMTDEEVKKELSETSDRVLAKIERIRQEGLASFIDDKKDVGRGVRDPSPA
jgi:transcription initiation factor IIE alpha subunit